MYVPIIELLVELEQYSKEDVVWKEWTSPKGDFISLSKGDVHYILEGPNNNASLVLILHGISTSSAYMTNISKSLQNSGFRMSPLHHFAEDNLFGFIREAEVSGLGVAKGITHQLANRFSKRSSEDSNACIPHTSSHTNKRNYRETPEENEDEEELVACSVSFVGNRDHSLHKTEITFGGIFIGVKHKNTLARTLSIMFTLLRFAASSGGTTIVVVVVVIFRGLDLNQRSVIIGDHGARRRMEGRVLIRRRIRDLLVGDADRGSRN